MQAVVSKFAVILSLLIFLIFTGCSDSGASAGSECTKDSDCRYGRVCEGGVCVEYGDSDSFPDGDSVSTDGDWDAGENADKPDTVTDGDTDGDNNGQDGDSEDGNETSDGDLDERDTVADGDNEDIAPDGDEIDGDMDTDSPDSDSESENDAVEEDQGCDPHASVACNNGDVYWKDCNGNWSGRKEDCGGCLCSQGACQYEPHSTSACHDDHVYWYDCYGALTELKEDCGECGCANMACEYEQLSSLQCYNGDVYWFDCMGEAVMRSEVCGNVNCIDGECTNYPSLTCADEICFDSTTQLEWEQNPLQCSASDLVFYNHEQARRYCNNLSLGGEDWRLPNITELRSLVRGCPYMEAGGECNVYDECETCGIVSDDVCLDDSDECHTIFCDLKCSEHGTSGWLSTFFVDEINISSPAFWSSSRVADDPGLVWVLYADYTSNHPIIAVDDDPTYGYCPLCVRGPVQMPR